MKKIILTISFILIGFFALGQQAEARIGATTVYYTFTNSNGDVVECEIIVFYDWECHITHQGLTIDIIGTHYECEEKPDLSTFWELAEKLILDDLIGEADCIPPCTEKFVYCDITWASCCHIKNIQESPGVYIRQMLPCEESAKCVRQYKICHENGEVTKEYVSCHIVGTNGCPIEYIDVILPPVGKTWNEWWETECFKTGPCEFL